MASHIYFSPHCDDVALSCGGRIIENLRRGDDVTIVNVFTSDAISSLEEEEPERTSAGHPRFINDQRRDEDHFAWSVLGIVPIYLSFPEALLRKRFPFKIPLIKLDLTTIDAIYRPISELIDMRPLDYIYFPAAVGNHIDHVICREIGLKLLKEGHCEKVVFYEDIPYSWMRFIRVLCYRRMMKNIKTDGKVLAVADRRSGTSFWEYIFKDAFPFPNGRSLFGLMKLGLLAGRIKDVLSKRRPELNATIQLQYLPSQVLISKSALLDRYRSQMPLLFGGHFSGFADIRNNCAKEEVFIEVRRGSK